MMLETTGPFLYSVPYRSDFGAYTLSAIILYAVLCSIYELYISPLHSIPGPWYAAISDFWATTHLIRMQQCKSVDALFDAYGSVVRLGPNKVVFRDLNSMKNVYSVHKFDKSKYYLSFILNDSAHTFCVLDNANHTIRRKGYANHYTPTHLARFIPEIYNFISELLDGLDAFGGNTSLDCLTMVRHLMVDVLVNSSHGIRLGAVRKWASGQDDIMSTAIHDFPLLGVVRSLIPRLAWVLVSRIPSKRWQLLCDSDKILTEFVRTHVDEMRAQIQAGKIESSEKWMVLRLLQYKYDPSTVMPDSDIISETVGHMLAGADTSSICLSFCFWEFSRRADIIRKLQAELDQAMLDPRIIPDISVLQKLPYLNAFIKEGLRMYGPVATPLERVVPSTNEPFYLNGYALPPGTVVATQGWSVHRDPAVFSSPDTFIPDRWLETSCPDNSKQLAKMQQHFMPFGLGSRVCIGQHLAMIVMRIAIAAIVRNFDIIAPPETNEKSMAIVDSFVIFPAARACKLNFRPRT